MKKNIRLIIMSIIMAFMIMGVVLYSIGNPEWLILTIVFTMGYIVGIIAMILFLYV